MGITYIPDTRKRFKQESGYLDLSWGSMRSSAETALSGTTAPAVPTYDTAVNLSFNGSLRTGTGSATDVWWQIAKLPERYLSGSDFTVQIDGKYTLGGDAVLVAATIDVEAFPYDSTNGDFSNADICATAAQNLATSFATKEFTLTGTGLTPGVPVLLRLTSVINITSAGGAGTGRNTFNNPTLEYTFR